MGQQYGKDPILMRVDLCVCVNVNDFNAKGVRTPDVHANAFAA